MIHLPERTRYLQQLHHILRSTHCSLSAGGHQSTEVRNVLSTIKKDIVVPTLSSFAADVPPHELQVCHFYASILP